MNAAVAKSIRIVELALFLELEIDRQHDADAWQVFEAEIGEVEHVYPVQHKLLMRGNEHLWQEYLMGIAKAMVTINEPKGMRAILCEIMLTGNVNLRIKTF